MFGALMQGTSLHQLKKMSMEEVLPKQELFQSVACKTKSATLAFWFLWTILSLPIRTYTSNTVPSWLFKIYRIVAGACALSRNYCLCLCGRWHIPSSPEARRKRQELPHEWPSFLFGLLGIAFAGTATSRLPKANLSWHGHEQRICEQAT